MTDGKLRRTVVQLARVGAAFSFLTATLSIYGVLALEEGGIGNFLMGMLFSFVSVVYWRVGRRLDELGGVKGALLQKEFNRHARQMKHLLLFSNFLLALLLAQGAVRVFGDGAPLWT